METSGFKRIYFLEQWKDRSLDYDFEKIVDYMITHVSDNLN